MRPRERVLTALEHREPDQVPLDIGGTDVTGINVNTYRQLLPMLGEPVPDSIPILDMVQQLAVVGENASRKLDAHCRAVFPNSSSKWNLEIERNEVESRFKDEWGIVWRHPEPNGYYYDIANHPLGGATVEEIAAYRWPDPLDPARRKGVAELARRLHEENEYAVILSGITGGGPMEMAAWLAGFENFFVACISEPEVAEALLDEALQIKLKFWQAILAEAGPFVDIISESEDLGMQDRLLVSPQVFRRLIQPRLRQLFAAIKAAAPNVKILLHSDGAILPLLPDLIEIGVDILNPVQVSAEGMGDTAFLKREFGRDLTFWGGIDTQRILAFGTCQDVREEVQRRIDDLAPGGGYVLASVHNIQADVPPENVIAMWQAWSDFGRAGTSAAKS
jgi:uroporphyrinogen decarboxylase